MEYKSKDSSLQGFDSLTRKEKIIFLAGVFDGEGTFGCYLGGHSIYKKKYFMASVEATDFDLVTRFEQVFPVGSVRPRKIKQKDYHKQAYIWKINGKKAWPVIEEMIPYMCKRRRDKFYDLVQSYRNSSKSRSRNIQKQKGIRNSDVRSSTTSCREDEARRDRV